MTFDNAMVFNPPSHPVHQAASSLLKDLEKMVAEYALQHQALVMPSASAVSSGAVTAGKGCSVDDILAELKLVPATASTTAAASKSATESAAKTLPVTAASSESVSECVTHTVDTAVSSLTNTVATTATANDHIMGVEGEGEEDYPAVFGEGECVGFNAFVVGQSQRQREQEHATSSGVNTVSQSMTQSQSQSQTQSVVVSPLIVAASSTSTSLVPQGDVLTDSVPVNGSSSVSLSLPLPRRDSDTSLPCLSLANTVSAASMVPTMVSEDCLSISVSHSEDPTQSLFTPSPSMSSPSTASAATSAGHAAMAAALPVSTTMSIMQDIAKAVQRMNDDLFLVQFSSLSVSPSETVSDSAAPTLAASTAAPTAPPAVAAPRKRGRLPLPPDQKKENTKFVSAALMAAKEDLSDHAKAMLASLTPDTSDPDPLMSSPMIDSRHTFLENCQYRHYQFDTLRRAKHSSLMLLYHLHRPLDPATRPHCAICSEVITELRWSCTECPQGFDVCCECKEDRMPAEITGSNGGSSNGAVSSVSSVSSEGATEQTSSVNVKNNKSTGQLYHHPHPLAPFRISFV